MGLWDGTVSRILGWHHLSFPQVRASNGIDNTNLSGHWQGREMGAEREWAGAGEERGGKREKEEEEGTLETMKSSLDICGDS